MRKFIYGIGAATLLAVLMLFNSSSSQEEIAVIVPLQHEAMDAIVNGIKAELGDDVEVHVYNAQGDATLQAAILQQIKLSGAKVVLPIGTATTQMTIAHLPDTQIIHLAARFEEKDRSPGQLITGILDELPPERGIHLARRAIPGLAKVTLIHSATEKALPEALAFEKEAVSLGIKVQRLMIQAQSDLYTMSQQIDSDSGLVAVLKDHMVVAGMTTIREAADRLRIPVMASDEGSVYSGAHFASGVPESAIGIAGAKLVRQVLDGSSAADIPIQSVDDVRLFFRKESARHLSLTKAAEEMGYRLEEVDV